jgi:sarcosine oxidase delta subunit
MRIVKYKHHDGEVVFVRKDLKGKHREHCLCFQCSRFFPEDRGENCVTAELVFAVDRECGLVTPVWECPFYQRKKK